MGPSYIYNATVVRVVDGDTVDLDVDLGFHMTAHLRFRLYGIDAWETRGEEREKGLRAKERAMELLPVGEPCRVQSTKTGKFGRWLGAVWNNEGTLVNFTLVREGHAVHYGKKR